MMQQHSGITLTASHKNPTISYRDISNWILNYAKSANKTSLVIGVSGGIDSAVTSTLCAKTGLKVYLCMLDINSKEEEMNRAYNHCLWLKRQYPNIKIEDLPLTRVYEAFVLEMEEFADHFETRDELTHANTKARLRMTSLYFVAGNTNGLVVGTGNKVEDFGVGFFTKWGDGGVDISPIADLTKTQVREIGKTLEINKEILEASPTDGLWGDERTDEDQLGCTYEELEWAMDFCEDIENGNDTIHRAAFGLSQEQGRILDIYQKFNRQNSHKMNPIPVYKVKK